MVQNVIYIMIYVSVIAKKTIKHCVYEEDYA